VAGVELLVILEYGEKDAEGVEQAVAVGLVELGDLVEQGVEPEVVELVVELVVPGVEVALGVVGVHDDVVAGAGVQGRAH
jgi:hypothetical protein